MNILKIMLLVFLVSCGEGDDGASQVEDIKDNTIRIDNINGSILDVEAGSDVVNVEIGPVKDDKDDIVPSNSVFEIKRASDDIFILNNENEELLVHTVESSSEGLINFNVKVPNEEGLYSLTVQAKNYNSAVGVVYIQVNPSGIDTLGDITTSFYQDLNGNQEKDPNEMHGVLSTTDTRVTIGPLKDKFGNLIKNGEIEVELYGAIFSDFTNENNEATSTFFTPIRDGYSIFNVFSFDEEPGILVDVKHERFEGEVLIERALDRELVMLRNQVDIEGEFNLGTVFLGNTKDTTLTLVNNGNTIITSLSFDMNAPFEIKGGDCLSLVTLDPDESCTLTIEVLGQIRSFISSLLTIRGNSNGAELDDIIVQLTAQSALRPDIELSTNSITFEDQTVGEKATKFFTITNTGDVDATGLSFQNPPPYPGQSNSFYTFRSPESTELNENPALGFYCGTVLPPGKRCKVYVDYLPEAKVGINELSGSITIDGLESPKTFFVKGRSFLNNFEENIEITTSKEAIAKDEVDTMDVEIGPIRDKSGIVMEDVKVEVRVYRETTSSGGSSLLNLGDIDAQNEIIGGPEGTSLLLTDNEGIARFSLKSHPNDTVGDFTIRARIVDDENRVLSEGFKDSEFLGSKLLFSENPINFEKVVLNNSKQITVNLINDGSVDAQGVQVSSRDGFFQISDEMDCQGIISGTKDLATGESCSFNLEFLPENRQNFFDELQVETQSIGTNINSSLFGEGINPATISTELRDISGTYVVGEEAFSQKIIINNLGDEDVKEVQAFSTLENNSFSFDVPCTELGAGKSCPITMSYQPESAIPYSELNAEIVIEGIGVDAEFGTQERIPLEILHSSLVFVDPDPGINIQDCYELQVRAFDIGAEDPLDHSQPIQLNLSSSGQGNFYTDNSCSTTINSVEIAAEEYYSPLFYYRPTEAGNHLLRAQSPVIASAIHSFSVYKEPVGLVIAQGNNQDIFTEERIPEKMVARVVDEDGNGVPNIPVDFNILKDIRDSENLVLNGRFNNNIDDWQLESGSVYWQEDFEGTMRLDGNLNDLGSEILNNEKFQDGIDSWEDLFSTQGNSFNFSSSQLNFLPATESSPAGIGQNFTAIENKVYQIEGDFEYSSGSGISIRIINNETGQSILNERYSDSRVFRFTFTAPSSDLKIRIQNGPGQSVGSLSYISLKEIQSGVLDNTPSVLSSIIATEAGQEYYISSHVKDMTGNELLRTVEVQVLDGATEAILHTEKISEPVLNTFSYTPQVGSIRLRFKQLGFGPGVTSAIDNIYVTKRLDHANLSPQLSGNIIPPGNGDFSISQASLQWFLPEIEENEDAFLIISGGKLFIDDGGSLFNPTAVINMDTEEGQMYKVSLEVSNSSATKIILDIKDNIVGSSIGENTLVSVSRSGENFILDTTFKAGEDLTQLAITPSGEGRSVEIDNVLVKRIDEQDDFGDLEFNNMISGFEGPGNISLGYFAGLNPLPLHVRANLSNNVESEILFSHNVEFPTRISGFLGDFILSGSGPSLIKDGNNNLNRLFNLDGYNWDSNSKTLTLPANEVYDFNSLTIESGTTLKIDSNPVSNNHGWTQLLAKNFCEIQGNIKMYGAYGRGNEEVVQDTSIDREPMTYTIPQYTSLGGNGGHGGHGSFYRVHVVGRTLGELGTIWKGGDGGYGAYGSNISRPAKGLGGRKGYDAPGLFLKCFKSLNGLGGTLDSTGEKGINATRGGNAGGWWRNGSVWSAGGGSGGGGGGPGGNGGKIIMSYERLINQPNFELNYGGAGSGAGGGTRGYVVNSYWYNPGCKGCGSYWRRSGRYGRHGGSGSSGQRGEKSGECLQGELTRGKIKKRLQPCF